MRLPEELLGQEARCPGCGCVFTPAPQTTAPFPSPGPPPISDTAIKEPGPLEAPVPANLAEAEEERPWERTHRRRTRRDAEPHRGPLVLVLGIVGLVIGLLCGLGLPFGAAAWVMGYRDLRKMRYEKSMDPEGEGMTQAGMVCGAIGTFFALLCGLGMIGYVVFIYMFVSSTLAGIATNPAFSAKMRPMTTAATAPAAPVPPPAGPAPDEKREP
jgi:hypothetical protein